MPNCPHQRKPAIILRADADQTIGSGHVVRLLHLSSEFLKRECEVVFLHSGIPEHFVSYNPNIKFFQLDPSKDEKQQTIELITSFRNRPKVLVTDGDRLLFYDESYQREVREHGVLLVTVTFFAEGFFLSDIILNQNVRASSLQYEARQDTEFLLGLRYAVMDKRFATHAADPALKFESKKEVLLLFFGGADASDTTRWALCELRDELRKFEIVHVAVGALYPHVRKLKRQIRRMPGDIRLHHNTREMPDLMAAAKYAIVSGGLSLWELACTKTAVLCMPFSERERLTCENLSAKGLVENLGPRKNLKLGQLAEALKQIIDQRQLTERRVHQFARQITGTGASLVVDKVLDKLER